MAGVLYLMAVASIQNPTPKKMVCMPKFLAAYRRSGNISFSCRAAGITRDTYYEWKAKDARFAAACEHAADDALDGLERAGWQRARKSSDLLLMFFLKAGRPAQYRETYRHEHTGADGEPFKVYLNVSVVDEV
jgi:hypothetical protein